MAVKVINDRTDLVEKALESQLESALYIIGQKMEGYAKMKCPVDTGRLRNSISNAYDTSDRRVVVGTNVEYAPYVELGRRGRDGKHFLKNSIEEHIDEYKRIAILELSK